jgi:D-amino peptidase
MRVLIVADMEGVSGIAHSNACARSRPEYGPGVRLLADEVNVLAQAAYEAGASTVSVIDWHGGGGNLSEALLDERVPIVEENLTAGYDVVLLSGFHPMAGDPAGFISHTMYRGIIVEVNGRPVGELWLLSRWAGTHNVPVALVAGDQAAIAEAALDLPETPGVAVKKALSFDEAEIVPVADAHRLLFTATRAALREPEGRHIYRSEGPLAFRLKLDPEPEQMIRIPALSRDADGWLVGEVMEARQLIELIDAVAAMRVAQR